MSEAESDSDGDPPPGNTTASGLTTPLSPNSSLASPNASITNYSSALDNTPPLLSRSVSISRFGITTSTGSWREVQELRPQPGWLFYVGLLACISFMSFGSYYSYDSVSALEEHISTNLDLSGFQFGLLSSVYAFPNIIVVLIGGYFIDKYGNKASAHVLCALVAAGTGVVAIAGHIPNKQWSFYLMLAGRFIFGLGAESSYVAQNSMCVEWFTGKKLATALGVTMTVSRLGSIAAYAFSTKITRATGNYVWALWFAFGATMLSVVAVVIYSFMDKWVKGEHHKVEARPISLKEIKNFSPLYWIALLIATLIYSTITPLRGQTSSYVVEKWDVDEDRANFILSLIDITSLIISPLCGWIVDKTHQRGWIVFVGNVVGVLGYMILSTPLTPYVGIITLGIHTTVVPAALYPCIPLLISAQFEGIGYAAMSSLINAALAGVSPLVGWILESFGFFWLCFCLAAVTLLAAVLSIVWNIVDFKSAQPILNEPEPPQEELSRLLDTERGDESMKQITTLSSASAVTTDCDTIHLDS